MKKKSLYDDIPDRSPEEVIDSLLSSGAVRIERIVSFGQASPEGFWYDQEENEWVVLLEGFATLGFDNGSTVDLVPGDYLNIAAGCRHRVERTASDGRTVWLAVFY
jgi:cupin 2 domain-containing protein